jgi:hypothetical protein
MRRPLKRRRAPCRGALRKLKSNDQQIENRPDRLNSQDRRDPLKLPIDDFIVDLFGSDE